jgi:hypothetical protein
MQPSKTKSLEMGKKQALSELDLLERRAQVMTLTPEERARLDGLQKQDLNKPSDDEDGDFLEEPSQTLDGAPALPSAPNGAAQTSSSGAVKANKKPDAKKKKKPGQDEANLNQLMQF